MDSNAIDRLASDQHGLVTRAQLVTAGADRSRIYRLAQRGDLISVGVGVYRFCGAPATWRQRVLAAVLEAGPDAWASHRTATALQGCEGATEGVIEVIAPRHLRNHGGIRCHETLDLPAADRTRIDSIPVTAIDRTLIDVGRYWSPDAVGKALDFAVKFGHTTYPRFQERVFGLSRQGRNGIGTARQVLTARGFGDGWAFEKAMALALRDAGLPEPTRELKVRVGSNNYYVDFAYPDSRLGIECDSTMFHTIPYQREYDLKRQNEIVGTGLLLMRYTPSRLRNHRDEVTDEIRQHLETRIRR